MQQQQQNNHNKTCTQNDENRILLKISYLNDMAVEMENLKLDSQFYACHSRVYVYTLQDAFLNLNIYVWSVHQL